MSRHDCPGDDCGYCEARIAEAEYRRDFPDTDDCMADGAAADMVFGRWEP